MRHIPENTEEANKLVIYFINKTLQENSGSEVDIIADTTKLSIPMEVKCDKDFCENICDEMMRLGWYCKYNYYWSFIYRHRFILSMKPIIGYDHHLDWDSGRIIKSNNPGRQCSWFKGEVEIIEHERKAASFMSRNSKL